MAVSKNLADASNEWELVELKLADLDFSIVTALRTELDDDAVEAYLRDWDQLPPIDVYIDPETGEKRVADGGHRGAAGKLGKKKLIKSRTKKGGKREAELYAMGRNEHHGVRRTNEEKRKIVERLLNDPEWQKMSARWMQEKTGVDAKVIRAIKRERQEEAAARSGAAASAPGGNVPHLEPVVGKDGKAYPARQPIPKPTGKRKKSGSKMGFDGPTQRTAPVDELGNELEATVEPWVCSGCGEMVSGDHGCIAAGLAKETADEPTQAPATEDLLSSATWNCSGENCGAVWPILQASCKWCGTARRVVVRDTEPAPPPLPGKPPPAPLPDSKPVRVPTRVDLTEVELAALHCVTEADPGVHAELFDDWEQTEGHGESPEEDARGAVVKLGVRFE